MPDAIAIAPELQFSTQAHEFITHLSRSSTSQQDAAGLKDLLAQFEPYMKTGESGVDVSAENKKAAVKLMVQKVVESKGALEGNKEADAENSHLLLEFLLADNFDTASTEYSDLVKSVVEAVKKGGEAAWASKRTSRHENASRVLSNTYNFLPSTSPARPTVLLALITLLSLSSELKLLSLTAASIVQSLSQWSISHDEKIAFLRSASQLYAQARESHKALELQQIAIEQLDAGAEGAERTIAYALADEKSVVIDDVLRIPSVGGKLSGKAKEVATLFQSTNPVDAVKQGKSWVESNKSWIEGFSLTQLTGESILRKLRLIALVTVASQSSSQQLSYDDVASALEVSESEVEVWVVDAIQKSLIKARLSQPTSTVRILSVSAIGTRSFGASDWQLLEQRLKDWKRAVSEVQGVIAEAEGIAAQGPITHRSGAGGNQQSRRNDEVTA